MVSVSLEKALLSWGSSFFDSFFFALAIKLLLLLFLLSVWQVNHSYFGVRVLAVAPFCFPFEKFLICMWELKVFHLAYCVIDVSVTLDLSLTFDTDF